MTNARLTARRELSERGATTITIVAIVVAVLAGGSAVAYAATDGFGTRADPESTSATAAPPAPPPTSAESEPIGEPTAEPAAAEPELQPNPDHAPRGLPAGFPDIGVPIYSPAETMTAVDHSGEMWVVELVTDDHVTTVNQFIEHRMVGVENEWRNVSQSPDGDMTITEASTAGFTLVIAVGPERIDASKTSIHYTVRQQ